VIRSSAQMWSRDHFEALLTAAALPLILVTSAPGGHWASGWEPVLAVAAWLPLIVRNRWPVLVAALVVLLETVDIVVAAHGHPSEATVPVATMLALYTVSLRSSARVAWGTAAVVAGIQSTTALLSRSDHGGQALLYVNWAIVATLIGRLIRARRDRIAAAELRADIAERTKADEARRQVAEERMRIARDLHDVLAHHITVVNAQAAVAQYLLRTDPSAAQQALSGITENTRAALDELRATLGLLRTDNERSEADERSPAPGLDEIPALIASFTSAGGDVAFETEGAAAPLSGSAELALYRILQEALTNATKHAPGCCVHVMLRWQTDAVVLTVVNSPPSVSGRDAGGTGQGLVGMRERAVAAGGDLTLEPSAAAGYTVRATLPVVRSSPRPDRPLRAAGGPSPVGPRP
jgi:signal transduction histidine kinase